MFLAAQRALSVVGFKAWVMFRQNVLTFVQMFTSQRGVLAKVGKEAFSLFAVYTQMRAIRCFRSLLMRKVSYGVYYLQLSFPPSVLCGCITSLTGRITNSSSSLGRFLPP